MAGSFHRTKLGYRASASSSSTPRAKDERRPKEKQKRSARQHDGRLRAQHHANDEGQRLLTRSVLPLRAKLHDEEDQDQRRNDEIHYQPAPRDELRYKYRARQVESIEVKRGGGEDQDAHDQYGGDSEPA